MAVNWGKYGLENDSPKKKTTKVSADFNRYTPEGKEKRYKKEMSNARLMEIDNVNEQKYKEQMDNARLMEIADTKKQEGLDSVRSFASKLSPKVDPLSLNMGPINQETVNNQIELRNRNGTIGPDIPNNFALDDVMNAFQNNDAQAMKRLEASRWKDMTPSEQTQLRNMALDRRSELSRLNSDSRIAIDLRKVADTTKPIADIGMALYTPGAGLGVLQGATRGAEALVAKALPKLAGSALGRIGQVAAAEAIVGAPTAVGQTLTQNPEASGRELLKSAAYGAGGGAILGGAGKAIGEGISKLRSLRPILEESMGMNPDITTRTGSPLQLPEPRARGRVSQVDTPDVIYGNDFAPSDGPLTLPEPKLSNPTTARVERVTRRNPYLDKYEALITEARRRGLDKPQQYVQGRTLEGELESLWSQMASKEDPSLDELIVLAHPERAEKVAPDILQRARESQRKREVYGVPLKAKTVEDRYVGGVVSEAAPIVSRVGRNPNVAPTAAVREAIPSSPATSQEARAVTQQTDEVLHSAHEREAQEVAQRVKEPRVRDRVYSYLDEAEKAARERIAKRRNLGFLPQGGNDVVDFAIIGASKLGKGTIKFSDWTEEMVKEFGEGFRKQAPKVYNEAKEVLRKQERIASKEGQEAMAFNESGTGDASSFDAKINRKSPKKKESFRQKWERIRTQFVDDLASLEGLEKRVRGRVASAEDSLYKSARMFKGVPEKAAQRVTQSLSPIIDEIEKAGYTADNLGRYALAKHAKDVNAAGYKSGFTNKEIEDVLQQYGTPEMEAAQQALVKVNRDMLKELVDAGVVGSELAETLNKRWENYIPLFRSFDDEKVEFEGGLSKALANVASPIKSLQGSERAVIDPLENMIKNIYRSTNAAERNKVASKLISLANIDKDGQFIRKLDHMEEVGRKNVVNVKVNGENVKYEVEPEVYKALLNLDQESSNMIVNILSKPASLLRAGATLTPEFSLRNPLRDVLQAFVVSKSGFNPITDFGAGLIQAISKGKLYRDWIDNLGAYGNVMSMDRKVHQQALKKVLGESNTKKFVNIVNPKAWIGLLRAISDTTESATKIGEYRAALRKGTSKEEAAYRSRDIMDFARAGTGIRQANKIVAFLNANIQGKSKLIRAIKENPAGTITRAITAVTMPTVGFYAWNKYKANDTQRETIDNAPDWMRDSFWLVAIPGTDTVARIPKPFDLAAIFSNLPERALDYVYKKDKKAFDGFISRSLSESSIPVQISGLLPIVEGMANYSFFRQGELIPQREANLAYKDQYDPVRTTETAKLLAKGAEFLTGGKGGFANFSSPRVMDNTIQGLTAGLGKYATDAIDSILMGKVPFTGKKVAPSIVDRPEAPSAKLEQKPFLRSFLVDPTQGGKVMDKFYDNLDKLAKEKSSNKLNGVTFGKAGKNDLYLPTEKDTLLKSMNKSSDAVSDINKKIREIEKSMVLSPSEKRKQIDVLMADRMKIIKDSVSQLK